jgi:signal transduction histidine kinase
MQDYFAFEFVGLSFTAPDKNRYAYKLEGFDKEWVECGTRRYASYTHLDGGTYTFRVRASNNDGVWNEKGASMTLVIHPPFWEEWWFRTIVVLIIAGVPFMVYRYRFIRLLEVERTRSRIARDLHDELSATLSGINFFTQAIERDGENKVSAKSERFLSLIHESTLSLQEAISDIIWSVNPGHDRWDQILVKFRRYASDLFDSNSIAYTIDLPDGNATGSLSMERRRNLWLIYKEIVTNTVKHSQCRNVRISLEMPPKESATLLVRDDGKGFDPHAPVARNGLNNIRSRAQALDATIDITSAPGEGTTWILKFFP